MFGLLRAIWKQNIRKTRWNSRWNCFLIKVDELTALQTYVCNQGAKSLQRSIQLYRFNEIEDTKRWCMLNTYYRLILMSMNIIGKEFGDDFIVIPKEITRRAPKIERRRWRLQKIRYHTHTQSIAILKSILVFATFAFSWTRGLRLYNVFQSRVRRVIDAI